MFRFRSGLAHRPFESTAAGHAQTHTSIQQQKYGSLYINYLTKESVFTLFCADFPCLACLTRPQVIPSKDSDFIFLTVLEL